MKDEDYKFAVRVARTPPPDRQSLIATADIGRKDYSVLARVVLGILQGKASDSRAAMAWVALVEREAESLPSLWDVSLLHSQTSAHTELAESVC